VNKLPQANLLFVLKQDIRDLGWLIKSCYSVVFLNYGNLPQANLLSWACCQSCGSATSPLARWGLPPCPMVAELAEATTSPPLRSLPEHPPAAYPLDGCTSRELGDLVGGPTRALELTLDLSPPPPQPA
jgi:hypothetical protein